MNKQQAIKQFMDKQLEFKPLSVDSKKLLYGGVMDYITEILLSSKWRIGKLSLELKEIVTQKVRSSVESNEPIVLVLADGGFKNHKCASYPHPDFAELMQVLFVINSVRMISQIYEPGISIEYTHDGDILSYIDNYPLKDIQQYITDFGKILEAIGPRLPPNVSLSQTSFSDFYDFGEMKKKIEKRVAQKREKHLSEITNLEERVRHAKNNFLAEERKATEEELLMSVLRHHVWLEIDFEKRAEYIEGGTTIPVAHRYFPSILPIYSYKGSDMQYWIANGLFDTKEDTRFKLISPNANKMKETEEIILEKPVLGLDFLAKTQAML